MATTTASGLATGTVYSITPVPAGQQATTGQVQQDETGDIFNFSDPGFPTSGLTLNSSCSFTLTPSPKDDTVFIASGLGPAPVPRLQDITASVTQDITAQLGDVITIKNSAVLTGTVTINGGKVVVDQNATISGAINVNSNGIVVAKGGGTISGGIAISTGGNMKVVNQGNVTGSIVANGAGVIIVGNKNGPGFITGNIDVSGGLRAMRVSVASTITHKCP